MRVIRGVGGGEALAEESKEVVLGMMKARPAVAFRETFEINYLISVSRFKSESGRRRTLWMALAMAHRNTEGVVTSSGCGPKNVE